MDAGTIARVRTTSRAADSSLANVGLPFPDFALRCLRPSPVTWRELIDIPWIVFVVYWAVAALRTRRAERRESATSRYSVVVLLWTGYALIFFGEKGLGILNEPMVAHNRVFAMTGVVLTWLGIGLALWARWHLGQYWSGRVTIKEGHELIRTGPYAHLRHPIYSGSIWLLSGRLW